MKYKIYCFILVFVTAVSCTNERNGFPTDETPYFQFSNSDKEKLIKPELIGSQIRFKNQFGLVRAFSVNKCKTTREANFFFSSFSGGSNHIEYYYDIQKTEVNYSDEFGSITYDVFIIFAPQNFDYSSYPPVFSNPKLKGYIDFSIFNYNCNNGNNFDCGRIPIEFINDTEIVTFNGNNYTKVRRFFSGSTIVYNQPNQNNNYLKTVNKFYYDDNYGIIGFDEIDGTNWRIE